MIGEPKVGEKGLKEPSIEEYSALKSRLSTNPDSDIKMIYFIVNKLEATISFLIEEFITVKQDYLLEVARCEELRKQLMTILKR